MVNKACFLDRDGVISELVMHGDRLVAPRSINEFEIKEEAPEAITLLKKLGFHVFVVTNQPDVLDGLLAMDDLLKMCKILNDDLHVEFVACALDRKNNYYKPGTMMIEEITEEFDIDLTQSYIIGDSWRDIVCGYASGLKTIYIGTEYTCPLDYEVQPDHLVEDVLKAAELIEEIELND